MTWTRKDSKKNISSLTSELPFLFPAILYSEMSTSFDFSSIIGKTFQYSEDLQSDLQENVHLSSENRLNTSSTIQLNINYWRKENAHNSAKICQAYSHRNSKECAWREGYVINWMTAMQIIAAEN